MKKSIILMAGIAAAAAALCLTCDNNGLTGSGNNTGRANDFISRFNKSGTGPDETFFTVAYDGNGNTGGAAPADNNRHLNGSEVVVRSAGDMEMDGHAFGGWCMSDNGEGQRYGGGDAFIITGNTTLYAIWQSNSIPTHEVTVTDGAGNGRYAAGSAVTITANTIAGKAFKNWAADSEGVTFDNANSAATTFTMPARDVAVTAVFETATVTNYYTLIVSVSPVTAGSVKLVPDLQRYEAGSSVTVTATANKGYAFTGWAGASMSTNASVTVRMDGNKTLTAGFMEIGSGGDSIPAATTPSTPTGVTATAASSSAITVSWNAVNGAAGYNVYRGATAAGAYSKVGATTTASYNNTGLSASTTYYYRVSATNAAGESQQSAYASATTQAAVQPVSPGLVFDINDNNLNGINGGEMIWYTYTFANDGATGTSNTDPAPGTDNNAFINAGGKVIFSVNGSVSGNVCAALAFTWFKDNKGYNRDISEWNGVYITYALTVSSGAQVYAMISSDQLQVDGEAATLTGYNEYRKLMPATPNTTPQRTQFKFSDFSQQSGWGTQVARTDILKKSHGLDFQMSTNGTATLTVTKIELYK
jgi:uncharacterized repeat protein (TIGR02543 family)